MAGLCCLGIQTKKEIVLPERRCTDEKVFKGIFKIVFSRTMIILLSILVQAAILIFSFLWLGRYTTFIFSVMTAGGAAVLIYLINKEDLPEFKIAWVIPICLFLCLGPLSFCL